jgi:hypothetical protein
VVRNSFGDYDIKKKGDKDEMYEKDGAYNLRDTEVLLAKALAMSGSRPIRRSYFLVTRAFLSSICALTQPAN